MSLSAHAEGHDPVLHTDTPTSVPFPPRTGSGFFRGAERGRGADTVSEVRFEPYPLFEVKFLQGDVYKRLNALFSSRIDRNNYGLSRSWINIHDDVHMDRVAGGSMSLAVQLMRRGAPIDWMDLNAMALATRFHDVGYLFPEGVDPETLTKEDHDRHGDIGADLYVQAIDAIGRGGTLPSWWTPRHTAIGEMAIRYHSNYSKHASTSDIPLTENPDIPTLSLLPRLVDKLDNSHDRVHHQHISGISLAARRKINNIRFEVKKPNNLVGEGERQEPRVDAQHRVSTEEALRRVRAYHRSFVHQLTPHAIRSQVLAVRGDGKMDIRYVAYPSEIAKVLGVQITPDDFLGLFDEAYGKSMHNAAAVVRAIRTRLLRLPDEPGETHLRAQIEFAREGRSVTREYAAGVRPASSAEHAA